MLPTWQCSVNFKTYFTPSPQRTDWNVPQQALNIKKSWGFQIGKHPIYLVLVERVEWKNDSWIWLENGSDITVQWSRTEGEGGGAQCYWILIQWVCCDASDTGGQRLWGIWSPKAKSCSPIGGKTYGIISLSQYISGVKYHDTYSWLHAPQRQREFRKVILMRAHVPSWETT